MPFWHEREFLELTNDLIKEEHKDILKIIERLYHRYNIGADLEEVENLYDELYQYSLQYFRKEEQQLKKNNPSKIAFLESTHKNLLQQLRDHKKQMRVWDGEMTKAFFSFFKIWIFNHMQALNQYSSQGLSVNSIPN